MSQFNYVADLIAAPPPTQMEYTRLGTSGLKVSKVILGTMTYGSKNWAEWVLEDEEALPLLEHAYRVGINTWDTVSLSFRIPPDKKMARSYQKIDSPTSTPTAVRKKSSPKPLQHTRSRERT